ncbi:uncharacterized protein EI90DRAFT_791643 [Cantharellus anzutake]|uniref:uncharacterized protein n=1 Tax=Cantharellus anzutake TaxID=1750568 RepID=UPI001907F431|nr:uncharacterized protein EI90DRAFT_791643 [Cantharellus anzutake]KAF8342812.1 hypothetical protein EI90DRAFT_791643 [Cantharellus anzutake]
MSGGSSRYSIPFRPNMETPLIRPCSSQSLRFLTDLELNTLILIVEVAVFSVARNVFQCVYSPRSYFPPPQEFVEVDTCCVQVGLERIGVHSCCQVDVDFAPFTFRQIPKNGLGAYLFVRFLPKYSSRSGSRPRR